MKWPEELLDAAGEVLISKGGGSATAEHPEIAARVQFALEGWLHGHLTTDQAVAVLRSRSLVVRVKGRTPSP